ncbi:MAG: PepSY-like domain-containing protein [Flavobacteriales bacterium]|nr:PepSY-like domain-containing protein [Flavobacteriales bacterium]MBP6641900.1 PepSY-like domain-containing protein [Flavobacteriales bacterium]MBP7156285.1 PepSY-like domain-containing protein [Flavobacteriales bacterium]
MNNNRKITRTSNLVLAATAMLFGTALSAQRLQPEQVPAPVKSAFDKAFSGAMDVEWDLKGTQYKVEFETGLFFTDHEAWYDATGQMLRHEEEIGASDLPAAVTAGINSEFAGYSVDDTERITVGGVLSYVVELELKGQPDWKVAYDANGKQLQKQQE